MAEARKGWKTVRHECVLGPLATAAEIETVLGDLATRCRTDGGKGAPRRTVRFRDDDSHLLSVEMQRP